MFDIAKKKAFVCDLDGTLFMGANPIKSAVDFVATPPAIVVETFDKVQHAKVAAR